MSRARMGGYAAVLLQDWLMVRGVGVLLLLALQTKLGLQGLQAQHGANWAAGPDAAKLVADAARAVLGGFETFAAVIAFASIVSNDRTAGFGRFLFAKPVAPDGYYLISWIVATLGLAFCVGLWSVTLQLLYGASLDARDFAAFGLGLTMDGSVIFLLSVVSRYDLIGFGIVAVAARLIPFGLKRWLPSAEPWLTWWLPPVDSLQEVVNRLQMGQSVPSGPVLHVVGYTVCAIAAAMLLLRRRPLTT
jgi:hypothetical protein